MKNKLQIEKSEPIITEGAKAAKIGWRTTTILIKGFHYCLFTVLLGDSTKAKRAEN